jgi:Ni/Co efflux regulator RcnB
MKKLILAGSALVIATTLSAQTTRRTTTVQRTGTAGTHHTTVKRTTNVTVNRHYHPGNWNRRRIHAGVYHYPHGYHYHHWVVGRPLPRVYLVPGYYYRGYGALGLAAPPPNYQWIRYGPDLLLVSLATGNVVDIRYGVFA